MRAADYHAQMRALMPRGKIWGPAPNLDGVLSVLADEMERVDDRVQAMLREADPRTAIETLADWETELDLPDGCRAAVETIQGRRERVVQKLTSRGGQSRAYFIDMARALGYDGCTITEPKLFTCASKCNDQLFGADWVFVWFLRVPVATRITSFTCVSACNEPLRAWGDSTLECVISRAAHAHTRVLFSYGVQ